MKVIHFLIFLMLLSVVSGCKINPEKNVPLPVFDLGTAISSHAPDTFTWNSIAKRITYVPVSTSPDELFAMLKLVYVGENFYCMVDYKTNTIICTDKYGKIIHAFSHVGQGPGEYTMITYVYVNPEEAAIHVFDQRSSKYITYDLSGNFVNEFSLKGKGLDTPFLITKDYVVAKGRAEDASKLCVADGAFTIQERLFPVDTTYTEMERLNLIWQINFCQNRDEAIVHYANEDTVYSVTTKGIQPICIFNKGTYKLPEELAKKPMEPTPQGSPYIRTMRLASIPGYYLISYMLNNHMYDEVWSKADNQLVSRFSNEDGGWGFPFQLPSGKKIRVNFNSLFIDSHIVGMYIPADIAAEEKLADVGEDDNPVLVIMEL